MVESIFVYGIIGLIGLLVLHELGRYRRARRDPQSFSYPRKRLSRRLGIALLSVVDLLMVHLKPERIKGGPELAWYGVCLLIMILIVWIILRELRETSLAVVTEHKQFYSEMEQRLAAQLQAELAQKKKKNRGRD